MQTFLPYASFEKSAKCLDNKRLGKQRVEAFTILKVLTSKRKGWRNHPAVRMWKGYEEALEQYLRVIVVEWISRGFANSIPIPRKTTFENPPWLGTKAFHTSHKSNLLRKDCKHYSKHWSGIQNNLPYIWPE
jgi:Pyrimidine dimer DNA glycosylase